MNAREIKQQQPTQPTIAGEVRVSDSPFFSFFNADNMEIMKQYPDKYFDLAIVDPPYGINIADKLANGWVSKAGGVKHKSKEWDLYLPTEQYFNELFRISKNQIIWGANYFMSVIKKDSPCWIFWDKNNGDSLFADGEMAWTSFDTPIRLAKIHWCGSAAIHETGQNKIHPTQKPIKLYDWCIKKYAKKNMKILDTHLGSGSIALAIDKANKLDNMNLEFVGIELDTEYFNAAVNRFRLAHAQSCLSF